MAFHAVLTTRNNRARYIATCFKILYLFYDNKLCIIALIFQQTSVRWKCFQELEAPTPVLTVPQPVQVSTGVQSSPIPTPPLQTVTTVQDSSERYEETGSVLSEVQPTTRIPRAGFSRSFQRMKSFLFSKSPSPVVHQRRSSEVHQRKSPEVHQRRSIPDSVLVSPET